MARTLTQAERAAVARLYDHTCAYCGASIAPKTRMLWEQFEYDQSDLQKRGT